MTTTDQSPTELFDLDAARRVVDELVAEGLPVPAGVTVRQHRDEVSLSLTLAEVNDLTAWTEHLDTVGAVDQGPWPMGGRDYRVAVGRLAGHLTVLAAEQEATDA